MADVPGNGPSTGAILSMATGLAHRVRRSYWTIVGIDVGLMAAAG